MRIVLILLTVGSFILIGNACQAQGGVRLIFWDYVSMGERNWANGFGVGYDHDMNERLSLGVQARALAGNGAKWSFDYRSAYHFSDNDAGSFYLGPQVSVMSYETADGNKTLIPLGMRCGVRGGLERFYADLFAAVHYAAGANDLVDTEMGRPLKAASFSLGLHMGWGWEKKDR